MKKGRQNRKKLKNLNMWIVYSSKIIQLETIFMLSCVFKYKFLFLYFRNFSLFLHFPLFLAENCSFVTVPYQKNVPMQTANKTIDMAWIPKEIREEIVLKQGASGNYISLKSFIQSFNKKLFIETWKLQILRMSDAVIYFSSLNVWSGKSNW